MEQHCYFLLYFFDNVLNGRRLKVLKWAAKNCGKTMKKGANGCPTDLQIQCAQVFSLQYLCLRSVLKRYFEEGSRKVVGAGSVGVGRRLNKSAKTKGKKGARILNLVGSRDLLVKQWSCVVKWKGK